MSSFCPGCGNSVAEGERFCAHCGRDSSAGTAPTDPAAAFGFPPENSGKAIFSFICGLLFFFLPFAIVAIIFGHLSLSEIRKSAGRLKGRGLAMAGLVLGYAGLAVIPVVLILAAIAIPNLLRARMSANETSAVSAVRTLNTAEIAYAQAHPSNGYTCSLSDLSQAWGISRDLARGQKNGYIFELQGCTAKTPDGPIATYQVVAYPMVPGQSGTPAFCSNESDLIKVARNGSARDCLIKGADLSPSEVNHPQAWSESPPR